MLVEKKFRVAAHSGSIYSVISNSKKNIFTGGSEGVVLMWDLNSIENPVAVAKVSGQIFSLCIIEDLNHLWIGTMNGAIHVLDLNEKKEIRYFIHHSQSVFDIQIHDKKIYTASKDGNISVWDVRSQNLLKTVFVSQSGLRKISFHPTKNEIAIGSSDNSIYILHSSFQDPASRIQLRVHTNSVFSLCYTNDGKYLLSGGRDAMLNCFATEENYTLKKSLPAHIYTINDIVIINENHFAKIGRAHV